MSNISKSFFLLVIIFLPFLLNAQRISYSQPQRDDSRKTDFEIIGKINGNFLTFSNNRSDNSISIFDDEMKLQNRVNLSFLPDRYINAYFIPSEGFFYMIYEYQKKNIVHCAAVKLDGQGKNLSEPVELDTTQISYTSNNKIYTTIISEDKQKIMIFKINSKDPKNYVFTTFLYNPNLELISRRRLIMPMEERNETFTDFLLDNEGTLVFAKFLKSSSGDYVSRLSLVTKGVKDDDFSINDLGIGDRLLDEIKIKIENGEHTIYKLAGFYYTQKRGGIEGLYSLIWDKATKSKIKESFIPFPEEMRASAKSSESNMKMAFNDYFINQIINTRNGGFLIVSESQFTTSRGGYFNRWDYMSGFFNPYLTPMSYYGSPYYYSPWNRYGMGNNPVRYHAENILILSLDKDCNLVWSNVIPKSQYDDESENLISNHIMNTGGELHFIYNQYDRRNMFLSDQSISPEGKITRYPTLRNLDKGYDFMPRYGKQVSANQMIIPCLYKNYLCFAKIDF